MHSAISRPRGAKAQGDSRRPRPGDGEGAKPMHSSSPRDPARGSLRSGRAWEWPLPCIPPGPGPGTRRHGRNAGPTQTDRSALAQMHLTAAQDSLPGTRAVVTWLVARALGWRMRPHGLGGGAGLVETVTCRCLSRMLSRATEPESDEGIEGGASGRSLLLLWDVGIQALCQHSEAGLVGTSPVGSVSAGTLGIPSSPAGGGPGLREAYQRVPAGGGRCGRLSCGL